MNYIAGPDFNAQKHVRIAVPAAQGQRDAGQLHEGSG